MYVFIFLYAIRILCYESLFVWKPQQLEDSKLNMFNTRARLKWDLEEEKETCSITNWTKHYIT